MKTWYSMASIMAVAIATLAMAIVLATATGKTNAREAMPKPPQSPDPTIDTSYGAKVVSQMLKDSVNTSVDPCEDFFSFVCDGYNVQYPLAGASRQGVNEKLQDDVTSNLTMALKRVPSMTSPSAAQSVQAAYNIFDACVAAKKDDYTGAEGIMNITKEYGGWPVMDVDPEAWTPERLPHDLSWILGNTYGVHGVATLLTFMTDVDWRNVTGNNALYIDQAALDRPAPYYLQPNLTEETKQALRVTILGTVYALANRTGVKLNPKTVAQQVDAMVEIEYELALISTPDTDERNSSLAYNVYNADQAQSRFDSIMWSSLFDGLTPDVDGSLGQVLAQRFILTQANAYMPKLNDWLKPYNTDPKKLKDLINYIIYRVISPYMIFAGPPIEAPPKDPKLTVKSKRRRPIDIWSNLNRSASNDELTNQEKTCASFLINAVPYVAGRLYVDSSFPPIARDDVSVMVGNMLSTFQSMLSGLTWMDNESILGAYKKINNMLQNIAYPDFQQDDQQLDEYYSDLIKWSAQIDPTVPGAFFLYVKATVAHLIGLQLNQVLVPGDRYDFLMSPAVVNDWYQPERNSITFPAAQLVSPFYDYGFPKAWNYGAMGGSAIGHEMTHGFDDEGTQYDWNGTLNTWMTDYTQGGFNKMAQCVVDEYDGICYPEGCVNGVNTQGENIADNGGVKAGYQAYQTWTFSHGEEGRLPDFPDYSMQQIYFMAFGYSWCGQFSDDFLTRILLTNEHAPYSARVNGVVQNIPEFGQAFQCKPGSTLYPKDHCVVW